MGLAGQTNVSTSKGGVTIATHVHMAVVGQILACHTLVITMINIVSAHSNIMHPNTPR